MCGPHRDDILCELDGVNVATFGSQGQQRSTVLAVKLAEVEFIRAHTGDRPVLLLDDVLSELDERRRAPGRRSGGGAGGAADGGMETAPPGTGRICYHGAPFPNAGRLVSRRPPVTRVPRYVFLRVQAAVPSFRRRHSSPPLMKLSELESRHKAPRALVEALAAAGYRSLYPPQAEAVRAGLLEGKNVLMAVPTAAGKTLVAEICMVKSILEEGGRCIYVVPLRALAAEKHEVFKKRYGPLGISVGVATGEYDAPGARLARFGLEILRHDAVAGVRRTILRKLVSDVGETCNLAMLSKGELVYVDRVEANWPLRLHHLRCRLWHRMWG